MKGLSALVVVLAVASDGVSAEARGRRKNDKANKFAGEKTEEKFNRLANGGEWVTRKADNNATDAADARTKQAKFFPIFNIVTFANAPCSSNIASSGTSTTNRNGTCTTTSQCQNDGGIVGGNCAAGFGVCCVFILNASSGGTVTQNCTYIQNSGFPSALADTTGASFTIQKCSSAVCDVRLDFETFTIAGTGATTETTGGACTDTLTITTSGSGQPYPTICGSNTGQHVYLNLGNQAGDTGTLAFAFTGTNNNRVFDIKVTQVDCTSTSRPPDGCTQYHEGTTGRIETFNFTPTTGETHLASQAYSICIRQEQGFCCVQYAPCVNTANAFSIHDTMTNNALQSLIDSQCLEDYVILGEGSLCGTAGQTGAVTVSKFCGAVFNLQNTQTVSIPICDCHPPFTFCVRTDATSDNAIANNDNTQPSRGVCMEYTQLAC